MDKEKNGTLYIKTKQHKARKLHFPFRKSSITSNATSIV